VTKREQKLEDLLVEAYGFIRHGAASAFAQQDILDRIDKALDRPSLTDLVTHVNRKIDDLQRWSDR
jgi:hypothetical protein